MNNKRISGLNRGGWRRHGDPPAWLDENLPIEQRRRLLDQAIRAVGRLPQQTGNAATGEQER
ncbi:MAG: hypothetical protein LH617_12655, partial [Ramlibacter sp.]|nr:hypothetical protein [Ramlibacter sp.]